jgi:hypothetical protein
VPVYGDEERAETDESVESHDVEAVGSESVPPPDPEA